MITPANIAHIYLLFMVIPIKTLFSMQLVRHTEWLQSPNWWRECSYRA